MARHEENIVARGEMREKTAVLDDVTDPAAELLRCLRGVIGAPSKLNRSAIGLEQADDQAQQGGFAATARADQHGGFAALEREVGGMERGGAAEILADAGELNQRIHMRYYQAKVAAKSDL